ncbi:hypothetical protein BC938DRAFT_482335 [Jimgerdemannia flammicorona]|uniref:Phosphatidylglycerol/phosphatidylinositol transfer protein n=1 Tax=Jimgerdemannia flammicorona TaxID=994334 RepID=A0A433QWD0_9FUNG|nr:hypothetical protein BC938DRAFT_482335 [Jimgerdemannia flammicorona]
MTAFNCIVLLATALFALLATLSAAANIPIADEVVAQHHLIDSYRKITAPLVNCFYRGHNFFLRPNNIIEPIGRVVDEVSAIHELHEFGLSCEQFNNPDCCQPAEGKLLHSIVPTELITTTDGIPLAPRRELGVIHVVWAPIPEPEESKDTSTHYLFCGVFHVGPDNTHNVCMADVVSFESPEAGMKPRVVATDVEEQKSASIEQVA